MCKNGRKGVKNVSKEQEIRTNILKGLYYFAKNNPGAMMERSEVKSKVGIEDDKILDFNMLYLEEKRFVKLIKYIGVTWAHAEITSAGIDSVENP